MRPMLIAAAAAAVLATPVSAQTKNVISGIDVMSATVLQEGQSSFSGLGLRARLSPETLVKDFELMPSIEYWRNSSTVNPYDIRTSRKDATLAFDVRYRFHPVGWEPYIGAGYGLHFLSSRVNAPSLGLNNATDSVIKGGLAALAGVSFAMNQRFDNFIELKYHHVTDYRQLKINWGLSFRL